MWWDSCFEQGSSESYQGESLKEASCSALALGQKRYPTGAGRHVSAGYRPRQTPDTTDTPASRSFRHLLGVHLPERKVARYIIHGAKFPLTGILHSQLQNVTSGLERQVHRAIYPRKKAIARRKVRFPRRFERQNATTSAESKRWQPSSLLVMYVRTRLSPGWQVVC